MPRTLCLSGAGFGAGCGARCALGEFLDRGANMIGTQVSVPLHHNRCLPAAGALDRVEVDPRGHRQTAGERVPEVVEAEVGDPRGGDGRPPVPLEVVQVLPLGRAEHERTEDLALALDRMERLSNDAVHRHPSAVARLVAANPDAAGLLVHVVPLERAQLAQPHPGVERDGDERAHPRGDGVEKACLLLVAQAAIAGVVLSRELDRGHWIVGEPALTDRAVEHRLYELQVVVERRNSSSIAERGAEVLDLPRRDVDRHPVAKEGLEAFGLGVVVVVGPFRALAVLHVVVENLLERHRPVTADQARTALTPGLPRLTDFRPSCLVLLSRGRLRVAARRSVVMPQRAGPPYPPLAVPPEHPSYLPPLRHPSPPGFCPSPLDGEEVPDADAERPGESLQHRHGRRDVVVLDADNCHVTDAGVASEFPHRVAAALPPVTKQDRHGLSYITYDTSHQGRS